jgi:transglutaminase-like putative cysteine protease
VTIIARLRLLFLSLPVCLWLTAGNRSGADEPPRLDPAQPYQAERSKPIKYDVDFAVTVTAPYKAKKLQVWLPVPQTDFGQDVGTIEYEMFPQQVEPRVNTEEVFGNKFAYFEFDNPQGAQIIRQRFSIRVWELRWNLDHDKVVAVADWPKSFDRFRRGETQAVVVNDRLEALLAEVVPQRTRHPLRDMSAVMSWVNRSFAYDHVDASLKASSLHALDKRHGHCSDYHGFCAAMGRAMGYPTRVTYGINAFPRQSPSHCKLEAFLPPVGWVSFDVSETQKLLKDIQQQPALAEADKERLSAVTNDRLLRGFRDNTWFVQTRGTDFDLMPKASRRVPVVRTIWAEADGVPLPDPDPSNNDQQTFAWMTSHEFRPDRPVMSPFADLKSLEE